MADYTLSITTVGETTTVVEAFDPAVMTSFVTEASDELRAVSEDARTRIVSALAALAEPVAAEGRK